MDTSELPITSICVVSDRSKCPYNHRALLSAHDDASTEADLWKESMFSFKRTTRYVCLSDVFPEGAFVQNVVADVALINDGSPVPSGFTALEMTEDSREKALRKKTLCIRTVQREATQQAVSSLILLVRQRKPPPGYILTGDVDGVLLCIRYTELAATTPNGTVPNGMETPNPRLSRLVTNSTGDYAAATESVSPKACMEDVPFRFHPQVARQTRNSNEEREPGFPYVSHERLESEFGYSFALERSVVNS